MCRAFRAEDIVARIGGDEFAVLLPVADADTARQVIARVREQCAAHNAAHPDLPIHFSLGASTAQVKEPLRDALRNADTQMYQDKQKSRRA